MPKNPFVGMQKFEDGLPSIEGAEYIDHTDPYMPTIQIRKDFENGYGVSIIRGQYSYGGEEGFFELAVAHTTPVDKHWELCYQTPITEDVIGWLTKEQVEEKAKEIEALPRNDECGHSALSWIFNDDNDINDISKREQSKINAFLSTPGLDKNDVAKVKKLIALGKDNNNWDESQQALTKAKYLLKKLGWEKESINERTSCSKD